MMVHHSVLTLNSSLHNIKPEASGPRCKIKKGANASKQSQPMIKKMKKIYIHIGCGKTGSSALQIWLNRSSEKLKQLGVNYPTYSKIINSDHEITSGNGVRLYNKIKSGGLSDFLRNDLNNTDPIFLYSSESFQNLTHQEIKNLKILVEIFGFELIPIIFIRDVYPMIYSSYQQLVKRHGYCDDFQVYSESLKSIQQFEVLEKYETLFQKMHVLHYDTLRYTGLEQSILEILGIEEYSLPKMSTAKVNRGLSISELKILKLVNKAYLNSFPKSNGLCQIISDHMIYSNPEKNTEFFYDEEALDIISKKFIDQVTSINIKHFNHTVLKILDLGSIQNELVNNFQKIDDADLNLVLEVLINNIDHSRAFKK